MTFYTIKTKYVALQFLLNISFRKKSQVKLIVVNTPWSLIGLDVSGPLKRTVNGNSYVLVALDYFTKYCVAKAVPDFTAETTAKFIFEEILCKLGSPKSIKQQIRHFITHLVTV